MTGPHAYYNDNDPYVCAWLSNLMEAGHITPGTIDDRSIEQIDPAALKGYERVHLFSGIGGWELALNLAGWQGPVWTGSCPCQPLSSAGQRKGHADERHLWPAFHRLIAECRPSVCFGEQVASKDGREWLSGIRVDLEHMGYAVGASDLPAACVGAPHVRQRVFWVSHRSGIGQGTAQPGNGETEAPRQRPHEASSYRRFVDGFGNAYRIPEPEIPFLDDGFPEILGHIRAYGNAIHPHVAAEFVSAFMESA